MMLRWQKRKEVMKSRIYPRGLISGEREISINANIFKQKVSPKFQFKDNFLEPSFGNIFRNDLYQKAEQTKLSTPQS